MIFNDNEETFIFIDNKNKIISFSKRGAFYLSVETTIMSCNLHYTDKEKRDEDYKKLKELTEKTQI